MAKIAVVGGGIFGCTIASKVAKAGFDVYLFEKNNDLICQASYINQYRVHRGYHYPRSLETAIEAKSGEINFSKEYGRAVLGNDIEHYYCISRHNSLTSPDQYVEFLAKAGLEYELSKLDVVKEGAVSLTVKVDELLFDPHKLKDMCRQNLYDNGANVKLGTKFHCDWVGDYDYVINATYSECNMLLPASKRANYQFELCEKPVVLLPKQYKNKSIVIMDGPFMCIDPMGNTGYHVMGHVVHAIHMSNVGRFPKCDQSYKNLLNNGIIKNPKITNFSKFVEAANHFFMDISSIKHIGSMFTFRAVLPDRDKDDARPTVIDYLSDKYCFVFSGKISTCVNIADKILDDIGRSMGLGRKNVI